jgi:hypothetical protein
MADDPEPTPEHSPDLSRRQAEIAAAMDETLRRQEEIRRRQDELLEQLGGIDRALDRRAGDEPGETQS